MCGDSDTWWKAVGNILRRLANIIYNRVRATKTIKLIRKGKVPKGRTVTYEICVCDYRPLKLEPYRVRLAVGGDRIEYPDDMSSPSEPLLEKNTAI